MALPKKKRSKKKSKINFKKLYYKKYLLYNYCQFCNIILNKQNKCKKCNESFKNLIKKN
jgi:hypothetical protein